MEIVKTSVYVGPNTWSREPLIRLTVDLHRRAGKPVAEWGEALIAPLLDHVPALAWAVAEDGGPFLDRARTAADCGLGELMAQVALALEEQAGAPGRRAFTRPAKHPDEVEVLFGYESEEIGLRAGDLARDLILDLIAPQDGDSLEDFPEKLEDFLYFAERRSLGPTARELVRAAEERDIPWIRLNNATLVQFGHGKYQQRIQATITSQTKHIAVEISCDKEDTHNMLNDLGLPVPQQRVVYSPGEAVRAARRIGFPVVVKPLDGNHGRGVSINLTEDAQIEAAFAEARAQSKSRAIWSNSFITGMDHRHAGGERRAGGGGQAGAGPCGGRRQTHHRRTGGDGEL